MMRPLHPDTGPALGQAACYAEEACRALFRMALILDDAELEVPPEVGELIEGVSDLSSGLLQAADDYGHACVERDMQHRAQADALEIEAGAKRRLADEYDAAQVRGEVATRESNLNHGPDVPEQNIGNATAVELGLTRPDDLLTAWSQGIVAPERSR